MGIQCQSEISVEKDRSVDLKCYSDAIVAAWDPYMELAISDDLTPEDLRPITRVMYASALIPGGKSTSSVSCWFRDSDIEIKSSIPGRIPGTRTDNTTRKMINGHLRI